MKNPKILIIAFVALLVGFAGYNLWGYFKDQQQIQLEEDRQAQIRREQQAQESRDRAAAKEAQIQQERNDRAAAQAAREAAEQKEKEEKAARLEAQRLAYEQEQREKAEKRAAERIKLARTHKHVEGIPFDTIKQLRTVSSNYILDNPSEFLGKTFNARQLGSRRGLNKMLSDDTNVLMLYAAISSDIDILGALIEIGIDVNSRNKSGFTPLMFASAYSTPRAVRFLIEKGADTSARAYMLNMNALHCSAVFNPQPATTEELVKLGLPLEDQTENDYSPLLLAITENRNLEVAQKLIDLGARTDGYGENGQSAYALADLRINNSNSTEYLKISDELDQKLLDSLK